MNLINKLKLTLGINNLTTFFADVKEARQDAPTFKGALANEFGPLVKEMSGPLHAFSQEILGEALTKKIFRKDFVEAETTQEVAARIVSEGRFKQERFTPTSTSGLG